MRKVKSLIENNDYVAKVATSHLATQEDIAQALQWAHELMEVMPDNEVPEIEDVFSDYGEYISSLNELEVPDHAKSACLMVSEAIEEYLYSDRSEGVITKPVECHSVQGMPETNALLNCHYAVLVKIHENSSPVIVDFTFSQFDENAAFPYVNSVQQWQQDLQTRIQALTHW